MKENRAIKALLTAALLIPLSSSFAWGNQSPTPSMKDQMKAMNGGSKATTIASSSPAPMGGTYFSVAIPTKVLSAKLFDVNGKTISLNDFKGKYVVVAPFLTSCQEICPMTSANMLAISKAIGKAKMSDMASVLEVTVDPDRDSATRLKAYQSLFNDSTWTIAGGSRANLKTFWGYFGVMATKAAYSANDLKNLPADWQTGKKNSFDVTHTDEVLIIGPDQKWKWLDLGSPDIGNNPLPPKLKSFLDDQGIANLQKPEQPTWTIKAVTSALSHEMGMKIG